jgi:selenide,water dikinase
VDFFTPIVDDPFTFGQIAAANALSDVYAMGGTPICAMNIVCFPSCSMEIAILREILRGGLEKLREAETVLAGGHSVEDNELKYGLAVTGRIHPERVLTNQGARPGDRLILTKPLGTGVINTAVKAELAAAGAVVHACTDVTGFGLIGHAAEMIDGTATGLVIDARAVPLLPEAESYAGMGLLPGGLHRNREYRRSMVTIDPAVGGTRADLLFDPQTSGGLLIALPAPAATALLARLHEAGIPEAALIGEVTAEEPGRIRVR